MNLYLPPQVKTLIVQKFGIREAYCFFTNRGQNVYHGKNLDKDPFRQ